MHANNTLASLTTIHFQSLPPFMPPPPPPPHNPSQHAYSWAKNREVHYHQKEGMFVTGLIVSSRPGSFIAKDLLPALLWHHPSCSVAAVTLSRGSVTECSFVLLVLRLALQSQTLQFVCITCDARLCIWHGSRRPFSYILNAAGFRIFLFNDLFNDLLVGRLADCFIV